MNSGSYNSCSCFAPTSKAVLLNSVLSGVFSTPPPPTPGGLFRSQSKWSNGGDDDISPPSVILPSIFSNTTVFVAPLVGLEKSTVSEVTYSAISATLSCVYGKVWMSWTDLSQTDCGRCSVNFPDLLEIHATTQHIEFNKVIVSFFTPMTRTHGTKAKRGVGGRRCTLSSFTFVHPWS